MREKAGDGFASDAGMKFLLQRRILVVPVISVRPVQRWLREMHPRRSLDAVFSGGQEPGNRPLEK